MCKNRFTSKFIQRNIWNGKDSGKHECKNFDNKDTLSTLVFSADIMKNFTIPFVGHS